MTDTYTITYTARTITYTLNGTDTTTGLLIRYLGDQGFGLAPLHRVTVRGPLQDGDSDIDFRLDPRVMQIPLMVVNASATAPKYQHYEIREKLLSIFRPGDNAYITVTRGDGVTTKTRRINVRVLGGMSFDVDPDNFHVRTVVQLRADDPTWYDPTTAAYTINQANIGVNQTITNLGNWSAYPVIVVTGPITNIEITNVTSGLVIKYKLGFTLIAGQVDYYDLRYGFKTVFSGPNQTGVNRIGFLDRTSSLSTWSLLSGANVIRIDGTSTTSATQAVLTYSDRYTGI
jgi:hypothetical protein